MIRMSKWVFTRWHSDDASQQRTGRVRKRIKIMGEHISDKQFKKMRQQESSRFVTDKCIAGAVSDNQFTMSRQYSGTLLSIKQIEKWYLQTRRGSRRKDYRQQMGWKRDLHNLEPTGMFMPRGRLYLRKWIVSLRRKWRSWFASLKRLDLWEIIP